MRNTKIDAGMWVVVCDGRKWLIFENVGNFVSPKLRLKATREQENPPTWQHGSDAPSRVHESIGSARSAAEQTDWHDEAERKFLVDLAKRLDTAVQSGEVAGLVIVAPPRALGMIRKHYSDRLRSAVRTEIDKDLVKLSVYEIENLLSK